MAPTGRRSDAGSATDADGSVTAGANAPQQDDVAQSIVAAASLLAERFRRGGRLLVHGEGRGRSDADHIAVEFLHPVITGKPALPALSGRSDAGIDDVTVSIGYSGSSPLRSADIALTDQAGGVARTDQAGGTEAIVIPLPASDAGAAKQAAVVAYHVLWEIVHVLLEAPPGERSVGHPTEGLYPMLYGGGPSADLDRSILESTGAKLRESAEVTALALATNEAAIERAVSAIGRKGMVFSCGNGGSATDAADVAYAFGSRGCSLARDLATVTALANDVGFDVVFARPLQTLARPGDSLVALSTSGASRNVLAALEEGAARGMATIGLAGYGGGAMAALDLDALLVVDSESVHRIQEAQTALYNEVVARIRS